MKKKSTFKLFRWFMGKNALPHWCVAAVDCLIVLFSGLAAMYLENGEALLRPSLLGMFISMLLFLVSFRLMHTYMGVVRYSTLDDLHHVAAANLLGSALTYGGSLLINAIGAKAQHAIDMPDLLGTILLFILATFLMVLVRLMVKSLYEILRTKEDAKRAFIYGVREGGISLAKSMQGHSPQQYTLVGFVSPNGELEKNYLLGVKVRRDGPNLIKHMKEEDANVLIVSPLQEQHFNKRQDLIDELIANNIKIMLMPPMAEWDGKSPLHHEQLHEVQIEDLLPRDKIEVNMDAIGKLLAGKRILITGAAGSIGSEMVRQVSLFKPAELTLVDQAETPMHDIRLLMAHDHPDIKTETIVTSITDRDHMESIFAEHRPEYIFHAAAYKHVPMMEDNPSQAVRNNIYGTRIIADLAVKYGVKKFVMISTDKAVNPTNVMGCSKRICEIYCQALDKAIQNGTCPIALAEGVDKAITQFVTTRFGNVLGSNGSVIPIFKQQIAEGGPVCVTHKDIVRYFMVIPEACRLVLEAGTMGHGGEIFVFDMGTPVKIVDLAKRMISLSGAKNIEIKFIGLRDGEKLYEEPLSTSENTKPTPHPKIKVAQVREYDYATAVSNEERLMKVSYTFDDMEIVKTMKEIVPEYKSKVSKYEVLDK